MKKTISVILAVLMLLSALSAGTAAYAADGETVTVTLNGEVKASAVVAAMKKINANRTEKSYPTIVMDDALMKIAERRAGEIMLFADTQNDSLPNGDPITTRIPGYGATALTQFARMTVSGSVEDALYNMLTHLESEDYAGVSSVGIGVFCTQACYSCYAVLSAETAKSASDKHTDYTTALKVELAVKNLNVTGIQFDDAASKFKASLTAVLAPKGILPYTVALPASGISFTSSKPAVMKVKVVKGITWAYPKKNGKFTLTVKTAKGTKLYSYEYDFNGYSNVSMKISSVKSPKKKTVKVSWTPKIIDFNGYQVQYSTDKKFKKNVKTLTVKGANKTSATVKKLKSKKTYYIRVRAFLNQGDGEKAYTKWSKAKKIKVK